MEDKHHRDGIPGSSPALRALRTRIALALLGVAVLPLCLLGAGAWIVFGNLLETKALELQQAVVRSHAQSIEAFLRRERDLLRLLAETRSRDQLTDLQELRSCFEHLNGVSDRGFVDLGVIGADGRHLAYVGPYDLLDRNYQQTEWFKEVMASGAYISEVFLGFRQVAHVIIAIRVREGDEPWILRATVNSDKFDALVATGALGRTGEAFLVNREGGYQTAPRKGAVLDRAPIPIPTLHAGVREVRLSVDGSEKLLTTTWINADRMMLVVQQDAREVRAPVIRALTVGGIVNGVAFLLVVAATFLATHHLTRKIEQANAQRDEVTRAFMRSAKLASVGELATGLAHEINNPLAIISAEQTNIADLVEEAARGQAVHEEIRESTRRIANQVKRCGAITGRMLKFGRKRETAQEPTQLGPRLRDVASLLQRQASVRNVAIRVEAPEGLASVLLDPVELEQVLVNLITNSFQAMPAGGEIRLTGRQAGGEVHLEVEDTGQGMPPEVRDKVFEPFFTTKPVGQGTGLGLAVCYGIVQSWGGRIEVESEPGRGTKVRIRLQAVEQAASPALGPAEERGGG